MTCEARHSMAPPPARRTARYPCTHRPDDSTPLAHIDPDDPSRFRLQRYCVACNRARVARQRNADAEAATALSRLAPGSRTDVARQDAVVAALTVDPRPPSTWYPPPNGAVWHVHAGGFAIITNVISEAQARALVERDSTWEPLFGEGVFESYRRSCRTSKRFRSKLCLTDADVAEVLRAVRERLEKFKVVGDVQKEADAALLKSLAGAVQQDFHADFTNGGVFDDAILPCGGLPYPLSCLVALQDGATITDSVGVVHHIPRLAACVWRGDLVHAGSAYATENVRLHIYYGVANHGPPQDASGERIVARGRRGRREGRGQRVGR